MSRAWSRSSWPRDVRVLIVDDDAEQRLALRGVLERAGYQVFEAPNGRIALDVCRTIRPWIVVLDAVMPVMDGSAFLLRKLIDAEIADIPVVMLSAWDVDCQGSVATILRKPARGHAIVGAVRSFARVADAA
ncbi:MAG: response regulator [Deltaproteobacteria bacterium]|nr:response regulator [Deltaproteobacteria bacterium]MDQ3298201.1 response regulator [Myxococcota bacterium]